MRCNLRTASIDVPLGNSVVAGASVVDALVAGALVAWASAPRRGRIGGGEGSPDARRWLHLARYRNLPGSADSTGWRTPCLGIGRHPTTWVASSTSCLGTSRTR